MSLSGNPTTIELFCKLSINYYRRMYVQSDKQFYCADFSHILSKFLTIRYNGLDMIKAYPSTNSIDSIQCWLNMFLTIFTFSKQHCYLKERRFSGTYFTPPLWLVIQILNESGLYHLQRVNSLGVLQYLYSSGNK